MGKKLSADQIDIAVEWWGERLRVPTFNTLSPRERNDPGSRGAAFAEILATTHAGTKDDKQVNAFKTALREELEDKSFEPWMGLFVDYHPDQALAHALEKAGLEVGMMTLPWKSGMVFPRGGVKAHVGYGTPFEQLLDETEDN